MSCKSLGVIVLLLTVGSIDTVQAQDKESTATPTSDYELVKTLIKNRSQYREALEKLRAHYWKLGNREKAKWAEDELRSFHRIPKQAFRLDLDVPSEELKSIKHYNDRRANELYRMAIRYKDRGRGTDLVDNQRRAEILLRQLLTWYPHSDKISDAAYELGDIYSRRPYDQYRRAAVYFERSYQWDTNTQRDSRLRAARIYDQQLQERDKARKLYRLVLEHETDPQRRQEATSRLSQLTAR